MNIILLSLSLYLIPSSYGEVDEKKCPPKFNLFEGKCVPVPRNAIPSQGIPGWDCKEGYVQKRSKCIKMNLPRNAVLTPDGKSWECKKDYVRYRGTCKREEK